MDRIFGWKGFLKQDDEFVSLYGHQTYKPGKTYSLPKNDKPRLCELGYHFGKTLCDVLSYYKPCMDSMVYARVTASGETDELNDFNDRKCVASQITVNEQPQPLSQWVSGMATTVSYMDDDGRTGCYKASDDACFLRTDGLCEVRNMPEVVLRVAGSNSCGVLNGSCSLGYIAGDRHASGSVCVATQKNSYVLCDSVNCLACVTGDCSRAEARNHDAVAVSFGSDCVSQASASHSVAVSSNRAKAESSCAVALARHEAYATHGAVAIKRGMDYGHACADGQSTAVVLPAAEPKRSVGTVSGGLGATLLLGFRYRDVICWYTLFVDGMQIQPDVMYEVVDGHVRPVSLVPVPDRELRALDRIKPVPSMEEVDKLRGCLNKSQGMA